MAPIALPTHFPYNPTMATLLPVKPPVWDHKAIQRFDLGPYGTAKTTVDYSYLSPFRRGVSYFMIGGKQYWSLAQLVGSMRQGKYMPIEQQKNWLFAPASPAWKAEWRSTAPIIFRYAARVFATENMQSILRLFPGKTMAYARGTLAGVEMPEDGWQYEGHNLLGLAWTELRDTDLRWSHFDWRQFRLKIHTPEDIPIPEEIQHYMP